MAKNPKQENVPQSTESIMQKSLHQILVEHPERSAFGVFLFLTFIFFFDVLFSGKVFIPQTQNITFALSLPWKKALIEDGIFALWNPFLFAGMPAYASLSYTPLTYIPAIPFLLLEGLVGLPSLFLQIIHFPLAGFGVYMFLRERKTTFIPSLLGGIAFMFAPPIIAVITNGQALKFMTIAYLPLVLWSVSHFLRQRTWISFVFAVLTCGLQIQVGHIQIVVYTWIVLTLYVIFFIAALLREKNPKRAGKLFLSFFAVLLGGLLLGAVQILPLFEYLPHSVREASMLSGAHAGFAQATQLSFSLKDTFTFFLPFFFGSNEVQTYWGSMPADAFPNYIGILILLLAVIAAIFRRKELLVIWLTTSALFSFLLALGKNFAPFYQLFFNYIPYFDLLYHPVTILVIFYFAVATLAGLGLQFLVDAFLKLKNHESDIPRLAKNTIIALGILFLLALSITLLKSLIFKYMQSWYPEMISQSEKLHFDRLRFDQFISDWWFLTIWIGGSLILLYFALIKKMSRTGFALGIFLLSLADLWHIDYKLSKLQSSANLNKLETTDEVYSYLKSDSTLFRIFPAGAFYNEVEQSALGFQSLGGFHAAKLHLFQEFMDSTGLESTYVQKFYPDAAEQNESDSIILQKQHELLLRHRIQNHLLNFLNVKYILSPQPLPEYGLDYKKKSHKIIGDNYLPIMLYENPHVLPRAYLVGEFIVADSAATLLQKLTSFDFKPDSTVLLEKNYPRMYKPTPRLHAKFSSTHPTESKSKQRPPKSKFWFYLIVIMSLAGMRKSIINLQRYFGLIMPFGQSLSLLVRTR